MSVTEDRGNKFVLYRDLKDGYRWRLRAPDGQTLAASARGHRQKASCEEECGRPWPTTRAPGSSTRPTGSGGAILE